MFERHVIDRLAAYAERQLDPESVARVESHLRGCDGCRAELAQVRRGIALASELEPAVMPGDVADRVRARVLNAQPERPRFRMPAAIAAGVVLLLAGIAIYWQVNRPWARLAEADAAPTEFEREGRELHARLKNGRLTLAYRTSDDLDAWRWLAAQRAPVTSLRPERTAEERARFVPVGASVRDVGGATTSVLSYRIDGQPVTLMLARSRDVADAPAAGWWSKRVTHRADASGAHTLTWTVGGGTYVMVSELEGYGQRACFICHTDDHFQEPIMELSP